MSRQVVLSGKRKEDKEAMKGKFTGVGVGPGDPQLLTLKALHAIQESDVVAIPVSDSGLKKPGENADPKYMQQCTAYQIVRQVYSQIGEKEVIFLPMPMIKDREKLIEIHDEDAAFTAEKLNEGKDVVFLTIGDPSIYSTCMYIHKRLKRMGYETELIPGIPSFCAAAARLDISLSENSDELHIIPASYGVEESMRLQGTKVFMKSGRKMAEVKRFLVENALEAKMVENCGMDSEKLYFSTEEIPEQAGYYSLFIITDESEPQRKDRRKD